VQLTKQQPQGSASILKVKWQVKGMSKLQLQLQLPLVVAAERKQLLWHLTA